jgi:hypothetical protein
MNYWARAMLRMRNRLTPKETATFVVDAALQHWPS